MFAYWIPIIFWVLINLANFFDAAGDAIGKKRRWILSKTYQMIMVLSICAMIPLARLLPSELTTWQHWFYFALMYMFIRVGIFNATWGLFRWGIVKVTNNRKKIFWWYLGTTSLWDKFLAQIINKGGFPEKTFLAMLYIISEIISIGILINGFYLIPE